MKKSFTFFLILFFMISLTSYSDELLNLTLNNGQKIELIKLDGGKENILVVPPPGINVKFLFPSDHNGLIDALHNKGYGIIAVKWGKNSIDSDNENLSQLLFSAIKWIKKNIKNKTIFLSYGLGGNVTLQMLKEHPTFFKNEKMIFIGVPVDFRYAPKLTSRWRNKTINGNLKLVNMENLGKPFSTSQSDYIDLLLFNYPNNHFDKKYFHGNWETIGIPLLNDWQNWLKNGYMWKNPKKVFTTIKAKSLWIAGEGDNLATHWMVKPGYNMWGGEKKYILVGRVNRFSSEVSHTGLVIGKVAKNEISKELTDWLDNQ